MTDEFNNRVGNDRITSRQIDELIGIARGLVADDAINAKEIEFLQKWLAANAAISDQPVIRVLYERTRQILSDGLADEDEKKELLGYVKPLFKSGLWLGEVLKSTSLPLCDPPPPLSFSGQRYCSPEHLIMDNARTVNEPSSNVVPLPGASPKRLLFW